jgi:hypothetical protein
MVSDPPPDVDPLLDPVVAAPVHRFVTVPAQAALAGPGPRLADDGEDIGYPTMVVVEAGEGWTDAKTPEAELAPVPESSPAAVPLNLSRTPVPGTPSLTVQLGERSVTLRPTEDAMWGYVTLAFKVGGFSQVIQARKAIDAAVTELERAAATAEGAASQAVKERNTAERQVVADPPGQLPGAAAWRLRNQVTESGRQNRELRAQANAVQWFKVAFNDLCARLAVLEEACLRKWEDLGVDEYKRILEAHMGRANQQWIRYGCYLKDKPGEAAKISASRGKAASVRVKLERGDSASSSAPAGSPTSASSPAPAGTSAAPASALPTLQDLKMRSKDLNDYAKTTISAAIRKAGIVRAHGDPREIELYDKHVEDVQKIWAQSLQEAEVSDAALLQIYRDVDRETPLDQVERMIVDALLDAYHLSKDLRDHLIRLLPAGATLRIQPGPRGDDPMHPWGLTDAQRSLISSTAHSDALALGLTIPASVVLSVKLQESGVSEHSPWMHLAVRQATTAKILRGRLAGLLDRGSLSDAAISHALDEFESFRDRDKDRFGTWSLTVLGYGLVLAPFTEGGSLVLAGLIAASFQIAAYIEERGRVESASRLSAATLDALESVLWARPSRVDLYRQLVSTAIDVTQAIVAPEFPLVVDLLIMATSWAISPEGQPSKGKQPVDARSFESGR